MAPRLQCGQCDRYSSRRRIIRPESVPPGCVRGYCAPCIGASRCDACRAHPAAEGVRVRQHGSVTLCVTCAAALAPSQAPRRARTSRPARQVARV